VTVFSPSGPVARERRLRSNAIIECIRLYTKANAVIISDLPQDLDRLGFHTIVVSRVQLVKELPNMPTWLLEGNAAMLCLKYSRYRHV
jgi:hypothetical protein